MKFIARKDDWMKYTKAVGDNNPVHYDADYARSVGLDDVIAPGMWFVGNVQGKRRIGGIGPIKFRAPIYDNAEFEIKKAKKKDRSAIYTFSFDSTTHCSAGNVRRGMGRYMKEDTRDPIYVHDWEVTPERVSEYLKSLHKDNRLSGHLPEMYFASLSAPALVEYGKKQGKTGLHGTQSFHLMGTVSYGPVQVYIKDGKRPGRGGVETFELEWMQNEKLLARGSSSVLPLSI